jgi:hypothetical protein
LRYHIPATTIHASSFGKIADHHLDSCYTVFLDLLHASLDLSFSYGSLVDKDLWVRYALCLYILHINLREDDVASGFAFAVRTVVFCGHSLLQKLEV